MFHMHRFVALIALLMTSTVADAQFGGGGFGGGGIFVDPDGVLVVKKPSRNSDKPRIAPDVARRTDLRQVSLRRIDQQLREHYEAGTDLPDEVRLLAGMVKIEYVLVDKQNRDVLLAGPAEGWNYASDGREVGRYSDRATLHLEDLATALRTVLRGPGYAKCSIDPQREGLAAVANFDLPIVEHQRLLKPYLKQVKEIYGLQRVTTDGVPSGSRFALVMIEADYRMKQIAIGVEEVHGLPNHLDAVVKLNKRGVNKTPMARWWFAPDYDPVLSNEEGTVFKIRGRGMELLNEEVFVDASGRRQGAGRSRKEWDVFSQSFTKRLDMLEKRYPVFGDLHNLFDLMMVAALVRDQGWGDWFADSALLDERIELPAAPQPKYAEPIVTAKCSKSRKTTYTSFAWGGVSMAPKPFVQPGDLKNLDFSVEPLAVAAADSPSPDAKQATQTANPPTENNWWADVRR